MNLCAQVVTIEVDLYGFWPSITFHTFLAKFKSGELPAPRFVFSSAKATNFHIRWLILSSSMCVFLWRQIESEYQICKRQFYRQCKKLSKFDKMHYQFCTPATTNSYRSAYWFTVVYFSTFHKIYVHGGLIKLRTHEFTTRYGISMYYPPKKGLVNNSFVNDTHTTLWVRF